MEHDPWVDRPRVGLPWVRVSRDNGRNARWSQGPRLMNMSCNPTREFSINRILRGITAPLIPSIGFKWSSRPLRNTIRNNPGVVYNRIWTTILLNAQYWLQMVLQARTEYHPKQSGGYLQQNMNNNSINAQYWLRTVLQTLTEYHPK